MASYGADTVCIHPRRDYRDGDIAATLHMIAAFDEQTIWNVGNHHNR